MHTFVDVLHWLTTSSHWSGSGGIPIRVGEHLELSVVSVGLACAVAIPVGLVVGHLRRYEFLAVSFANLGRAVPSFAILVLAYLLFLQLWPSLAFGFGPTVVALFLLSVPPILTNTYVGVQSVDADTVEAARGMGMTERDVLLRLELPLAAPLIMAGVRTGAVTAVATATLAALIGGGGLGRFIIDGFHTNDVAMVVSGAVLVAILSILTEGAFALVERAVRPRTSSRQTGGTLAAGRRSRAVA
ncbi:MAG: ABC transporter permease [Actinobacteria bacterium]|nr:MAG: ABC transporter permease [Actinomycetota bacterium]